MQFGQRPRDAEAEAGAAPVVQHRIAGLLERFRELFEVFRPDADAGVGHRYRDPAPVGPDVDTDYATRAGELDGVRQQV